MFYIAPLLSALIPVASAQTFDSEGGLEEGLMIAARILGIAQDDPHTLIIAILTVLLNYAALLGTIMIIVAGGYLMLSLGDSERAERAKRIIYYVLAGLVVILSSRVIVSFVTELLPSQV